MLKIGSSLGLILSAAISLGTSNSAYAKDCMGDPQALNTGRTITVKPADYPLVGRQQYLETLPLRSREVVLTFDDGPVPPHGPGILDALAAECAKATFFMLGANVAEAPHLARRAFDEGHTVGTHTFSHPYFSKISLANAKREIDLGIAALTEALGKTRHLAPFFRAPYLDITKEVEKYLVSRELMVWSIDADSRDWMFSSPENVVDQSISELEKAGKGILLLHDIKFVTARALPILLAELKRRGFRLVHVVPAVSFSSGNSKHRERK